jgi:hypothetical protein
LQILDLKNEELSDLYYPMSECGSGKKEVEKMGR